MKTNTANTPTATHAVNGEGQLIPRRGSPETIVGSAHNWQQRKLIEAAGGTYMTSKEAHELSRKEHLATKIAKGHYDADVAQLTDGETMTLGGPIGYRSGDCDIDQDLRFEAPDLVCARSVIEEIEEMVVSEYDEMVSA